MSAILTGLNEAQKQAVETTEGPVLILAGAGSGKTRTLTARIAYLIKEKRVPPSSILAVTFTNKAAGEMGQRVAKLLGRDGSNLALPWLGTFHRVCGQILRYELNHAALPITSSFTIYDSSDQLALIKQIMKDRHYDTKQYNPKTIKAYIEGAKNELLSAEAYQRIADGYFVELVAEIYLEYQKRLVSANAVDFDDLILRTLQLFENEPAILKKYQERFKYVLVDEYQDTNKGQYQLIKLWGQKSRNVFVVGDDWQAIYGFRGADFRNILNFEQDYPEAVVIKLEENYRSTQTILDAAHEIITKNQRRSDKKLFTKQAKGEAIKTVECLNDLAEGEFVIKESLRLARDRQSNIKSLDEIVVLYRVNAQSRTLEESLLRAGIPYRIVGALRFYDRKEVKDILAYLRVMVNPSDRVSFERIVNVPTRQIGPKTLADYYRSLENNESSPPKVAKFLELMDKIRAKAVHIEVDQLVGFIAEESGYRAMLQDGTLEGESRWENILELQAAAGEHESVESFLEQVALVQEADKTALHRPDSPYPGALTLMTLHAVKGLEFEVVFIVGVEDNLLPHSRALLDPSEMEEERRLCYVGMTRPKQRLYLVYALERRLFGDFTANPPSRFMDEIPPELREELKW